MKKKVLKTMVAVVCVIAAGMGGMKAYNAGNQSGASMLLAENVEALSEGDNARDICNAHCSDSMENNCSFWFGNEYWICTKMIKK